MSSTTPQPDRDQQLLGLGKQCSHPSCLLVDFLPFKCHHCSESFCQEHFKVDDHKCAKYDESKHNRIAPNCPLCNTPIAVAPGQDPNVRMDQHLDRECSVVVGKKTTSSTPRCKKPSCNKVLFANIRCDKCRQQFCPAHRFPGDHTCSAGSSTTSSNTPGSSSSSPASSSRPTTRPIITRPKFASSAKELNSKANAVGSATLGAIKKSASATTAAIASASASTSGATSSGSGSGPSSRPSLPFNKMDRPSPSFPSPNPPDTNVHAPSVTTSTSTTTIVTNDSNRNNNDEPPNVPPPVINSWSFAPPPIFAAA